MTTLADMPPGSVCRIKKVLAEGAIRQRLFDMGLIPSVAVAVVRNAPLNDPIELRIDDYFVTVRRAEARQIEVSTNGD